MRNLEYKGYAAGGEGPDHVYYNATINNPSSATNLIPAVISESRSQPVLENPGAYNLAITRFKVPTNNIPLFIWPDQPGRSESTPLTVTITFNGQTFQQALDPAQGNILSTGDFPFFVFTINQLLNSLNSAISFAFTRLIAYCVGEGIDYAGTHAPFLAWNPSSSLFTFYAENTVNSTGPAWSLTQSAATVAEGATLTFSSGLFRFFATLPAYTQPSQSVQDPGDVTLIVGPRANAIAFTSQVDADWGGLSGEPYSVWAMEQERSSSWYWTQFETLVFIAGNLPINDEFVPSVSFTQSGSGQSAGNSSLAIITDFEPDKSDGADYAPLQYFPQGPYRLVDMNGSAFGSNQPLCNFNVRIFWQDRAGILRPVYISPGSYASIKFAFIRKGLSS
jgi:hypothetical protein